MKIMLFLYFLAGLILQSRAQGPGTSSAQKQVNDSSGTLVLWQKEIGSEISAPLSFSGENIFIPSGDGKILCFDLDGNLLWNYETKGRIINSVSAENNVLVAAIAEGDLFSLDPADGELLQVIGLGEKITTEPSIIVISNRGEESKGVILGTANGDLYCYDLFTFELIWENHSSENAITGNLLFAKDRIIFGSRDKQLFCIDAQTGIINWKWKNSKADKSGIKIENTRAFITAANEKKVFIFDPQEKTITAIDLLLGTTIWQKKNFNGMNSLVISNDNKKLLIPGEPFSFYIISEDNGKLIKEIKNNSDDRETYTNPVEWNNKILFGSSSGRIYLIDSRYNWNTLFSLAEASVNSIINIRNNIFAAAFSEGRIIIFEVN